MKRISVFAVTFVMAVGLLAGCGASNDSIEQVAAALDLTTVPAVALTQHADFPQDPTPGQLEDFMVPANDNAQNRWKDYMKSRGMGDDLVTPTYVTVRADNTKGFTTACADRNGGKPEVSGSLKEPFLCSQDGATGTFYVPTNALLDAWNKARRTVPTMQAVMYAWLVAHQAGTYANGIYAFASSKLSVTGFVAMPFGSELDTFGFCIAGTLVVGSGLDAGAARDTLNIVLGDPARNRSLPAEALAAGIHSGKPGDCVRQYWSRG